MNANAMPDSEKVLVDLVAEHAPTLWKAPTVARELHSPSGGWADLGVLSRGRVYSVEAKLHQWQRAIAQATLNRYWADRSYIALWHSRISPSVLSEARKFGLGVISVRSDGVRVVAGARPTGARRHLKTKMAAKVQQVEADA